MCSVCTIVKNFRRMYTSSEINQELYNCYHSLLVWVLVWAPKPIHSEEIKGLSEGPGNRALLGSGLEDCLQPEKWRPPQRGVGTEPAWLQPPLHTPGPQLGLTDSGQLPALSVCMFSFSIFHRLSPKRSCSLIDSLSSHFWHGSTLQAALLVTSLFNSSPRGPGRGKPLLPDSEQTNCLMLFRPSWGKDVFPWHYSPLHVLQGCVIKERNTLTFDSCKVGRVCLKLRNQLSSFFSMRSDLWNCLQTVVPSKQSWLCPSLKHGQLPPRRVNLI